MLYMSESLAFIAGMSQIMSQTFSDMNVLRTETGDFRSVNFCFIQKCEFLHVLTSYMTAFVSNAGVTGCNLDGSLHSASR